jgi:hypothetical protein
MIDDRRLTILKTKEAFLKPQDLLKLKELIENIRINLFTSHKE